MSLLKFNKEEVAQSIIDSMFKSVEHGDEAHRKWLREELNKWEPVIRDALILQETIFFSDRKINELIYNNVQRNNKNT